MTTGMADGQIGGQSPGEDVGRQPVGSRSVRDDPPTGSHVGRFFINVALYVIDAMNIFIGWTLMSLNPAFSAYVDRDGGTIRFAGNQLKLQNGFGAWRQYRYECPFQHRRNKVVTTEVNG